MILHLLFQKNKHKRSDSQHHKLSSLGKAIIFHVVYQYLLSTSQDYYILYQHSFQRMNEALADSTNLQSRLPQELKPNTKGKQLAPLRTISDILVTSQQSIDFGHCICGSVHERKLGVIILEPQEIPRIISIKILFQDERLDKLPEYIFGVRKENSFDYFDDYKFKAMQKGTYSFVVGVKTPTLTLPIIKAKIQIAVQGFKGIIEVNLIQTPFTPQIKCNRQLITQNGLRLLKLGMVKNKSKKEVKVAFKCIQNVIFSFIAQLVSHPEEKNQSYVDVKPKNFQVGGKGIFFLNFLLNSLEINTYPFCVRRVLIIKIKDTQIHFHFPLEVMFYPGGTSNEPSIE